MSPKDLTPPPPGSPTNGVAPPPTGDAPAQLVTDSFGLICDVTSGAAALLGARREHLLGKPLPLLVTEARRHALYSLLLHLRSRGGGTRNWPACFQVTRDAEAEVLLDATALPGPDGAILAVRWKLREAALLAGARRALRAEREFSDQLLSTARIFVLLLDHAACPVRVNPHFAEVTGLDEASLTGEHFEALLPPGGRHALTLAWERGQPGQFTAPLPARDGRRLTVAWTVSPVLHDDLDSRDVLLVGLDVTDLHEAQHRAVEAERLAAIGQVVAALAHESRNLLQRGRSNLELLTWRLEGQPEALDLAARAQGALADLTRLFEDIRSYAAPLTLETQPTHLGQVLREAWGRAREAAPGRDATLCEPDFTPDLWCRADPFRLTQLFRILLDNSFEACPGPVRVDAHYSETDLDGRPALRVSLRDNGPGLSPEQRRRLFEPFYTTKPFGSGLGMAIARRIVSAHGGSLVATVSGPPGAEIVLTLPRS